MCYDLQSNSINRSTISSFIDKIIFSLFNKLSYNTIFTDILDTLFFQMKS